MPTVDLHVDVQGSAAGPRVMARVGFSNREATEVYALDRLWVIPYGTGKQVWDPAVAYRFVHEATLRLYFGRAPAGQRLQSFSYDPEATPLAPGARVEHTVTLQSPIEEYSILGPISKKSLVPVFVTSVEAVMSYTHPSECASRSPSAIDPRFVYVSGISKKYLARTSVQVPPFEVQRRTDADFPRLRLPGD
jgi:hypothetical protein